MSEPNHPRAHFHATYGEFEAGVAIDTLQIIAGSLPARAMEMTLAWAALHREELLAAWSAIRAGGIPQKIDPLP